RQARARQASPAGRRAGLRAPLRGRRRRAVREGEPRGRAARAVDPGRRHRKGPARRAPAVLHADVVRRRRRGRRGRDRRGDRLSPRPRPDLPRRRQGRRMLTRVAIAAVMAAAATAHADRVVAIAPLSTLGTEDTSAGTRKLTAEIEAAVAALPATKVVRAAQVADAIKRARKPQLRACEGDASCLAELATLVGAQIVISGEVGGLGESRVVYLAATESGKELRSTTLSVGARADGGPTGAVVRLLEPDGYRGTLRFAIDVAGATVYVNGSKVALSPRGELALP